MIWTVELYTYKSLVFKYTVFLLSCSESQPFATFHLNISSESLFNICWQKHKLKSGQQNGSSFKIWWPWTLSFHRLFIFASSKYCKDHFFNQLLRLILDFRSKVRNYSSFTRNGFRYSNRHHFGCHWVMGRWNSNLPIYTCAYVTVGIFR